MQQAQLVRAGINDLQAIKDLAHRVWNQYYPAIIDKKQIDYMLEKMYSIQSLTEQIQAKGHQFYFISPQEQPIGFISVNEEDNGRWFINKFYIDQEQASRGTGSKSFLDLVKITRAKHFRLTVNRQNYKAINFYFKNGFRIESVVDFDIGNGYFMNDFVMVWTLPGLNYE